MSKEKTHRDEQSLLVSIDAKLSALLSLALLANPQAVEKSNVATTATANFLNKLGMEQEDIAVVLRSTKDSVRHLVKKEKRKK